MWISKIDIENIRSFAQISLNFSKGINILVGANNSGKSSILLPLLSLQDGLPSLTSKDVRMGENDANTALYLKDFDRNKIGIQTPGISRGNHDFSECCLIFSGAELQKKSVLINNVDNGMFFYQIFCSRREKTSSIHFFRKEKLRKLIQM